MTMNHRNIFLTALLLGPLTGCVSVHTKVDPIEINVNVRIKIERELDDFFGDLDQQDPSLQPSIPEEAAP